ncbi:zinc-dependent metalloprotease [Roseateles sp. BYS180W]|uniref:Zinc-dependent metalloprotease n=1 Tax=Roseateles rivi TaxID=3299028 RepID=A0ABW7FUV7_9BURK
MAAPMVRSCGLLCLYQGDGKLYMEIPPALLGEPLLMAAHAVGVPASADHVGRQIEGVAVRFVRVGRRVLLQRLNSSYHIAGDHALRANTLAAERDVVLASFDVLAQSPQGAPLFEATRLFTTEVGDFSARGLLRASSLDASRSYVGPVKVFAGSVRVASTQTYVLAPASDVPGLPPPPPGSQPARSATVDMAYNFVRLPSQPMQPRLFDDRVGYFYEKRAGIDSSALGGNETVAYISRWRLEKRDPAAAVSEPIKPIVWYIDPATPSRFVPYVKQGIEAWNQAFEQAGFRNAVQARPYPSAEQDPEFDPEDVRYSVIRWVPSPTPNAYGPHLADPRSGEILNANIVVYHNLIKLLREAYIAQVGGVDARARHLPLPDALMGELVAYVVTHEVGHSLGLQHNMKASSTYPVERLRDPQWLREMGHTPSVMDYSRFNYLVQPEDHIDPALLVPRIGPYDRFAIHWGYAPVEGADSADAELPTLRRWVQVQNDTPWLRFTPPQARFDYGVVNEAVGDADAVTASGLGIRNVRRLVQALPGMIADDTLPQDTLRDLALAGQRHWAQMLQHVVALVGGWDYRFLSPAQAGSTYRAASAAQQRRALAFLGEQLFERAPDWWLQAPLTQRLAPGAVLQWLEATQGMTLERLLEPERLTQLQLQQAQGSDFGVAALLKGLRQSVLAPAAAPTLSPAQQLLRERLQRRYVQLLCRRASAALTKPEAASAQLRAELVALQPELAHWARSSPAAQRAHWALLRELVQQTLVPASAPPSATTQQGAQNAARDLAPDAGADGAQR